MTPWTWPQAVFQGRLAALNLYREETIPLKIMTRVNSMNLQGLPLNMLGAFTGGSEEISYLASGEAAFREIFVRDGRVTGGALIGNIAGAGPLHYRQIEGGEAGAYIRPSYRAMRPSLLDSGKPRRTAVFLKEGL